MSTSENWNSFDTAPRDGSKIIVKTPYGIEPGYKRWLADKPAIIAGGFAGENRWNGYDEHGNHLGWFVADFSKCGWLPFETAFTA